jgi:hypothetical protein
MKPLRSLKALFAALVLAAAAACSPDRAPLAPPPAPEMSLIGDLLGTVGKILPPVKGLLACNVTKSYTTTKVIGRAGGTITVGPHSLVIPRDALWSNQTITATAPKGDVVEVEFQPHGLQFRKDTQLTMSYRDCGLVGKLLPRIVYADDNRNILETLLTIPNIFRQTVTAKTDHFSSYLLAD